MAGYAVPLRGRTSAEFSVRPQLDADAAFWLRLTEACRGHAGSERDIAGLRIVSYDSWASVLESAVALCRADVTLRFNFGSSGYEARLDLGLAPGYAGPWLQYTPGRRLVAACRELFEAWSARHKYVAVNTAECDFCLFLEPVPELLGSEGTVDARTASVIVFTALWRVVWGMPADLAVRVAHQEPHEELVSGVRGRGVQQYRVNAAWPVGSATLPPEYQWLLRPLGEFWLTRGQLDTFRIELARVETARGWLPLEVSEVVSNRRGGRGARWLYVGYLWVAPIPRLTDRRSVELEFETIPVAFPDVTSFTAAPDPAFEAILEAWPAGDKAFLLNDRASLFTAPLAWRGCKLPIGLRCPGGADGDVRSIYGRALRAVRDGMPVEDVRRWLRSLDAARLRALHVLETLSS